MKSQLLALFIFAFLLVSMVKETDCMSSIGKRKKYEDSDKGKRIKVTNTEPSVFSFAFVFAFVFQTH